MIKAKKSLGQHFLKSEKITSDIILASNISANDTVLEIGPGQGILTLELLKSAKKVIAVEKDNRLIPALSEKFKEEIKSGKLILIEKDILDLNISRTVLDTKGGYEVVANIPYYITGQFLRKFLQSKYQPKSMTLLVQKEVAERIVAKDGKESLLSLSVKVFGTPKYIRTVPKSFFRPRPKVDSAILHISNISRDNFSNTPYVGHRERGEDFFEKLFFKVIHAGFAHKRKQLLPNLSNLFRKDHLIRVFEICKINPKSRAEDISLEKWLELCDRLI